MILSKSCTAFRYPGSRTLRRRCSTSLGYGAVFSARVLLLLLPVDLSVASLHGTLAQMGKRLSARAAVAKRRSKRQRTPKRSRPTAAVPDSALAQPISLRAETESTVHATPLHGPSRPSPARRQPLTRNSLHSVRQILPPERLIPFRNASDSLNLQPIPVRAQKKSTFEIKLQTYNGLISEKRPASVYCTRNP